MKRASRHPSTPSKTMAMQLYVLGESPAWLPTSVVTPAASQAGHLSNTEIDCM